MTFNGPLSIPTTTACGKEWDLVPSSCGLTTTTFLPANLPRVTIAAMLVLEATKGARLEVGDGLNDDAWEFLCREHRQMDGMDWHLKLIAIFDALCCGQQCFYGDI